MQRGRRVVPRALAVVGANVSANHGEHDHGPVLQRHDRASRACGERRAAPHVTGRCSFAGKTPGSTITCPGAAVDDNGT